MTKIHIHELLRKRFLCERQEVRLTGRYAKKRGRTETILYEIVPTNYNENKKKWVRLNDLYEIFHPTSGEVEFAQDLVDAVRRSVETRRN